MSTPITAMLEYQIAARHCPGALVHVERAGRVLAKCAAGRVRSQDDTPMHDRVRFRMASLTKPVVCAAAMMLVQEGRLELDAPIGQYLPVLRDLRRAGGQAPRVAPTVRDLMRHTSGLAYPSEIGDAGVRAAWARAGFTTSLLGLDTATFLDTIATLPLSCEPGTAFRYGYSTDVLGGIVEQLDALPLGESLCRRIFTPLGMEHTGFEVGTLATAELAVADPLDTAWHAMIPAIGQRQADRPWMDSGGAGLISTLEDYAAFGRWLADGGVVHGRRLLSEALFDELARDQLPDGVAGPGNYCGPGFGFGLGMAVRQDWGPSAMPCSTAEMTWSGISGTALFVQPREQWFALLLSANTASRMMMRMEFRRAAARL